MNQITRCDWLPERARWSYLARSGRSTVSREKRNNKSFIDQTFSVKMTGYWPRSFIACSSSLKKAWSITHVYSSILTRKCRHLLSERLEVGSITSHSFGKWARGNERSQTRERRKSSGDRWCREALAASSLARHTHHSHARTLTCLEFFTTHVRRKERQLHAVKTRKE